MFDTPFPPLTRFPDSPPVLIGYSIVRILARGGMSCVWLVRRKRDHRQFTVKVPFRDPHLLARFQREIALVQRMRHRNIILIEEIGGTPDRPWFVAPFYKRGTLRQRMIRGPIETRCAVTLVLGLVRGLRHAHEQDIIHRDIKPENILVGPSRLILADWGIARCLDERSDLAHFGCSLGTREYMAPEQADSSCVGKPADVYSVGRVLDDMVRGWGRPVPREVALVINRCLARDPAQRYEDAGELEADMCMLLREWA